MRPEQQGSGHRAEPEDAGNRSPVNIPPPATCQACVLWTSLIESGAPTKVVRSPPGVPRHRIAACSVVRQSALPDCVARCQTDQQHRRSDAAAPSAAGRSRRTTVVADRPSRFHAHGTEGPEVCPHLRFEIPLLARRLVAAANWLAARPAHRVRQ